MSNIKILNNLLLINEDNVPDLGVDTVHIWSVSLNQPADLISDFSEMLSDEEIKKANRFRFPHLRRDYIIFHATLRKLLAHYLGITEEGVTFKYGAYGKPAISENNNPLNIRFSISKSDETGIYAFMKGSEIGVDIEQIKPLSDMDSIVNRHFSRNEINIYEALQDDEKQDWFYKIWTRKEALLKALGFGLYLPPEDVDVSDRSNVKIDNDLNNRDHSVSDLLLDDLELFPGFKAAFCKVRTRMNTDYTDIKK